jgi:hypothetical protein
MPADHGELIEQLGHCGATSCTSGRTHADAGAGHGSARLAPQSRALDPTTPTKATLTHARSTRPTSATDAAWNATPARRDRSAEHVATARAVAEGLQRVTQRGAVRSVLGAGHVAHVGLPTTRVAATLQAWPAPTPDRRWVLVASKPSRVGMSRSARSRRASAPRRLTTSRRGRPRRSAPRKGRRTFGYFEALNRMRCTPVGRTHCAAPVSAPVVAEGTQNSPARRSPTAMTGVRTGAGLRWDRSDLSVLAPYPPRSRRPTICLSRRGRAASRRGARHLHHSRGHEAHRRASLWSSTRHHRR